jgi:hypothetical protein
MTDDNDGNENKNDTTPAPASTSNGVERVEIRQDVGPEPERCARCKTWISANPAMPRDAIHPAAPGLCLSCGHAVIVETAIARFSDMATTIHVGLEKLAASSQGAGVLAQLAGVAPAVADPLAELGAEAKRVDLVDVGNRYAVSVNGEHVVILAAVDRTKLPQQEVLNLCAWLSVLADLSDGDLIAARRKVVAT